MRKTTYYSIALLTLLFTFNNTDAQYWRGKHVGLPSGFSASKVYGEGTMIIVTNSSAFSGSQVYYTPDSSTAYMASPSTLGTFATMESDVVRCRGVLFAGSTGGLYKSHDNGQTWVAAGITDAVYALYAHNDTLYASIGAGLGIPKMSVDTGNTWIATGYTGPLTVSMLRSGSRFFAGNTSNLQYTDNFSTWTTVTSPAGMSGVSMVGLATLGTNIYAACSTGVYKSTDNGTTWNNVLAKTMFSLKAIDTSLFGGTSINGMYQSNASGTGWVAINNGLPYTGIATYNSINSISFNDDYIMCSAGGDSTIYVIKPGDLGLHPSGSLHTVTPVAKTLMNISLFPNPASDFITLQTANTTSAPVSVQICDLSGRTLKSTNFTGSGECNIDVKYLPAGMYLVKLSAGNELVVKKLVLSK